MVVSETALLADGPLDHHKEGDVLVASRPQYDPKRVAAIFLFPALGGLLFGYDIGATAYVVPQLMSENHSGVKWYDVVKDNTFVQGSITSSGVGGALLGSLIVFQVTDRLGTRREMIIAALLFVLGAMVEYFSGQPSWDVGGGLTMLMFGRWIYGVGCGFAMHGAPSYIAELSPPDIRGALVALKECMIVLGMLLGYVVGYCLSSTSGGWRYTYLVGAGPAVVMFFGVARLPAPPRWIAKQKGGGDVGVDGGSVAAKAMNALRFVYPQASTAALRQMLVDMSALPDDGAGGAPGPAASNDVLNPVTEAEVDAAEAGRWSEGGTTYGGGGGGGGGGDDADGNEVSAGLRGIFTEENRRALIAGLGLVTLQQVTGQPSILYYAKSIFEDAGMAAYAAVLTGSFKLVMTLLSVIVVDRYGRRWLLFVGVSTMVLALAVMVVAFWGDDSDGGLNSRTVAIIMGMFLYIGGYQVSFGPISWLLISEIFPLNVRDQAISVAVFTNFAWNVLVSFLYPVIVDSFASALGEDYKLSAAFSIFLVLTIYSLYFIKKHVPETKGMTLEQIDAFLKSNKALE